MTDEHARGTHMIFGLLLLSVKIKAFFRMVFPVHSVYLVQREQRRKRMC